MKKLFLIVGIVAGTVFVSCDNKKNNATEVDHQAPVTEQSNDNMVKGSYTNSDNQTLHYEFDNANSTAVFKLNGEDIHMKQEPMASGIRYSNDDYVYSEHQGEITLTKDGKVIFSHQR